MAVVAEFSADVQVGTSPLVVVFTDESTGSPDHWLWDFGDGEFSEAQHPTHTYTNTSSTQYTVKLTAWIADTSSIDRGGQNGFELYQKLVTLAVTPQDCLDELLAQAYSQASTGGVCQVFYYITPSGGTWSGVISEGNMTISLPSPAGAGPSVFTFRTNNGAFIDTHDGTSTSDQGGFLQAGVTGDVFLDVTGLHGQALRFKPDLVLPGTTPIVDRTGVGMTARLYESTTASADDIDSEEKENFIAVGDPPVASFVGTPLIGPRPLLVSFTDLSTGSPTSWSWKSRVNESGGSFAEFSITQHPSQSFG